MRSTLNCSAVLLILIIINVIVYTESKYFINTDSETAMLAESFRKIGIVPNIIPRPPIKMLIGYLSSTEIGLGDYISPFTFAFSPLITYDAKPRSLYTMMALNVDGNYALHKTYTYLIAKKLVVNIPGHDETAGDTLVSYGPMLPIPGNGIQRYLGLIYEQKKRINVTLDLKIRISTNSSRFNLNEFVKTNNLGDPISGNFVLSSLSLGDCPPSTDHEIN